MSDLAKIHEQLKNRKNDYLETRKSITSPSVLIHTVHSDIGVARNGGRRGARYGAKSIINILKKMTVNDNSPCWWEIDVCPHTEDSKPFDEIQKSETDKINIDLKQKNIHLGGGHDHIYPLLKSLEKFNKPIHVINIDAHLDTRTDILHHSGTPFRQFADECTAKFKLSQIGIHDFTNAKSNFTKFNNVNSQMNIYSMTDINNIPINDSDITIFSVDCDALSSSYMKAVSAVNHQGISIADLYKIYDLYSQKINHKPIFGIYEYNPIFDDLSNAGARFLAAFIYKIFHD